MVQPAQFYQDGKVFVSSNDKVYISIKENFKYLKDIKPATGGNFGLSTDAYWSNVSLNLNGTERLQLNLTNINMEFPLTNNSKFKFAWKFESTQYDFIGFILYTPTLPYWVVSYFGDTNYVNGTKQGIYEYKNEKTNTWYEHEINIGQLYLQSYGTLPEKIISINLLNVYLSSSSTISTNQVSYFDDFTFYSNNGSVNVVPSSNTSQNSSTKANETAGNTNQNPSIISNIFENESIWVVTGLGLILISIAVIIYKSNDNRKILRDYKHQENFKVLKTEQKGVKSIIKANICINCQTKLDPADRFCENCGTPIIILK